MIHHFFVKPTQAGIALVAGALARHQTLACAGETKVARA